MQKNQEIIDELKQKLKDTQMECEEKIKMSQSESNSTIEKQERQLHVLHKAVETKLNSAQDKKEYHLALKKLFLDEISRIESEHVQKENNLAQWKDNVMIEIQQEREEFNERLNDMQDAKNEFEQQLMLQQEAAKQQEDVLYSRIDFLSKQKDALEKKVDETTKQINSLQGSLVSKRQESTTDETKWESEKQELFKSLNEVSDILEDNSRIHAQQIKSMEDGYKTTLEVLDKRIKMVNDEKRLLEKQLGGDKTDFLDEIEQNNQQIHQLRSTNTYLIGLFDEREKQAASEVDRMRNEVSSLQAMFDSREVNYISETRKYADNLDKLHGILEKAYERIEEGWDPMKNVSQALKNQVDSLQNQIQTKDDQLEQLRNQVIEAQNSQRKEITQTVKKFRSYLTEMNQKEAENDEIYSKFLDERLENDKISRERELDDMNKINDALGEIDNLKFKIRELEATNKHKEYEELNSKYVKTQAELAHAKQNLVNYIQSLNTLEDKLQAKLEDSDIKLDENDEILRLRMENIRLNEENSSLVNAKQLTEADLNNRIENLTKKLFTKTEECEELHRKYTNLLNSLNGNREEEIKSWIRRQDLIKRTIEELRRQLQQNIDDRNTTLAMKDEEHKLTIEEVKLLRTEATKLQKFWDNKFNEWVHQEKTYRDEISALRDSLDSVEEYYNEAAELRKAENEMLAEQRRLLKEKEDFYIQMTSQMPNMNQSPISQSSSIDFHNPNKELRDHENQQHDQKTSKIINMLKQELEDSHNEIKKLKDQNIRRLKELEDGYEKKISIINEKEGTAEFYNQKLKNKLDETEQLYKELHNNDNIEKIILRNQVKVVGKLTNEKVEKTLLEKENIKARLHDLTTSAELIEKEEADYKSAVGKQFMQYKI